MTSISKYLSGSGIILIMSALESNQAVHVIRLMCFLDQHPSAHMFGVCVETHHCLPV